jgi:hypothetical protein
MLTKNDLQKLAEVRLEDAELLFKAGRSSSAYYLKRGRWFQNDFPS